MKHISSAAIPACARLRTALPATAGVTPLSIRRKTRGLADSTPRLHATAPPRRNRAQSSEVKCASGRRSVPQRRSSPLFASASASLPRVFGATESCDR